ncbi:hypothetical protein RCO27_11035 [Sphingosinicella sp. LHD-64]|uniref:hypothetical protein n=1 Tax=Sphingosinicella sp. LHD-64 TaxID=3072139 RepID=UPI0028103DDD|nr:hypothetical protein [Sphingosinicella sp. LHD-64]MDQ8756763.1 hypothetical protein [Sphingosinicella sp. LHD-64]
MKFFVVAVALAIAAPAMAQTAPAQPPADHSQHQQGQHQGHGQHRQGDHSQPGQHQPGQHDGRTAECCAARDGDAAHQSH